MRRGFPKSRDALMTDTELKPCPFCGSANLRFRDSDIEGWISHVECVGCDDMLGPMSEYKYDDVEDARADAANVWNRRALSRERGEVKEIVTAQVQSVCDWDDRTSPDDYPDHLLFTPEELTEILENVVDLATSRIRSCLLDKPEAVEAKPVAWRWRFEDGGPWYYGDKDPSVGKFLGGPPAMVEAFYSTTPAAANSPITPIVNKNGSGTNSETPERTCPNGPKGDPKNENIGEESPVPVGGRRDALVVAANILIERLEQFERELNDDDVGREYYGHVHPAFARLVLALAAKDKP